MVNEEFEDDFDEQDDIIIPTSVLGELVYIAYIIFYMFKKKEDKKETLKKLRRQIYFFVLYLKNSHK